MPKYYPINEEAAKRAKDMNSFSDYQPGSATAGYRAMVDEAYAAAERQKARVDPMYHDKIDALVDRYARKLAENLNIKFIVYAYSCQSINLMPNIKSACILLEVEFTLCT